jgi:hypothetical protein
VFHSFCCSCYHNCLLTVPQHFDLRFSCITASPTWEPRRSDTHLLTIATSAPESDCPLLSLISANQEPAPPRRENLRPQRLYNLPCAIKLSASQAGTKSQGTRTSSHQRAMSPCHLRSTWVVMARLVQARQAAQHYSSDGRLRLYPERDEGVAW